MNDKTIRNVADAVTTTTQTRVVSSASVNAFTHERFIFTGSIRSSGAVAAVATTVGICVVHLRGDSLPISNMSVVDDVQMWPDDTSVLFQGLWSIFDDSRDVITLHIDVKGKRKLRIGDSVQMLYKCNLDNVCVLTGTLTSFAKLA